MSEPKLYQLEDKDVLMFGDSVGLAWYVTIVEEKQTVTVGDNTYFGATVKRREYDRPLPHIDFFWLRQDENGEWYEDEDSPVAGGLSLADARAVAAELTAACDYLDGLDQKASHP